ncbi:MAG TPA: BON domain-containing protein [Pirellulales bacterium]|nr:BON domain-containing protein [Pirellulales bacterium]
MQNLPTLRSEFEDRDLERRVVNYLEGRHVPGLRHLSVHAEAGIVTLRGRVQTFYEKQLCQSCCRRVAGVVQFVDAVDVAYSQPTAGSLAYAG